MSPLCIDTFMSLFEVQLADDFSKANTRAACANAIKRHPPHLRKHVPDAWDEPRVHRESARPQR